MATGWRGHENFGRIPAPSYSRRIDPYRDSYAYQLSPVRHSEPRKPKKVVRMIVSQVHWCEYGGTENGHAFSSKDPNKERIVRSKETGKTDAYGQLVTEEEEFFLCGEHSNGLFRGTAEKTAKEIPGTVAS